METLETCFRCKSPHPSFINPNSLSFSSEADEIAYLNQELVLIDERMLELQCRKAHISCRLSEVQSTTRLLPPEILSEIFKHACHQEVYDKLPPLFHILSVSSLWSRTARSTPKLWSTLVLVFRPGEEGKKRNLLQLYLSNVGALPLSLQVRREGKLERPVLQALSVMDNAEKIQKLVVQNLIYSDMPIITKHFTGLTELVLKNSHSSDQSYELYINLKNQSRLRELSLYCRSNGMFFISSIVNLTTLKVYEHLDVQLFIQLLIQCQHSLVQLDMSIDNGRLYLPLESQPRVPVTLHRLRVLSALWTTPMFIFLGWLRLPALESLRLKTTNFPQDVLKSTDRNLSKLRDGLPDAPITLTIEGLVEGYLTKFIDILNQMKQVHEIHLIIPNYKCYKLLTNYINRLLMHLSTHTRNSNENTTLLPHLRRLMIRDDDPDKWFNSLLQMMKARQLGLMEHFYLELELQRLSKCQKEQLDIVVSLLREQGCSLSIDVHVNSSLLSSLSELEGL